MPSLNPEARPNAIREMTIGVQGRRDESIAALLIRPFRRQA
jgi:hypothetical protein